MGLQAGTPMREIDVDTVFIGSCTNGRIEDLRTVAAEVIKGHTVDPGTRLLVVPDRCGCACRPRRKGWIFKEAGAEWRGAGCSMCLGMNPDTLSPGERSASTSNRNFEGPAGQGWPHPPGVGAGGRRHRGPRPALLARRPGAGRPGHLGHL